MDQWVRDCNDNIETFLLCVKKGVGGHKAESYCLISMFLPRQGSESGQDLKLEVPVFPLGYLAQYSGFSAERRLPVPDKRGGIGYFLTGRCKKSDVVLLETPNAQFSSEYHKYMSKNIHNLTFLTYPHSLLNIRRKSRKKGGKREIK